MVYRSTFYNRTGKHAHELAFQYIHGVPDEIVYDQDKVFIVTENRRYHSYRSVSKLRP